MFEFQCKKCGTIFKSWYFDTKHLLCPKCYPKNKSAGEKEVYAFIQSFYSNDILLGKRFLYEKNNKFPKELDIYLPDINIAVEYNGIYWHSLKKSDDNITQPENNHIFQKMQLAEINNIVLINVYEDEWLYDQDNIKQFLLQMILQRYDKIQSAYLNNTIIVPRDKFNTIACKRIFLNYEITNFINPSYDLRKSKSQDFLVGNSGYIELTKM